MIDFNNLSVLTLTSLILAITFTVIAVAGVFYSIYKKGNFKNNISKFCCLLVLPFIALTMWTLAGLSISSTFANEEALAIIISMVVGAAAVTILYFVAKSILTLQEKKDKLDEKASREELVEELNKVEEDLSNLKGIINDVIEEPETAETAESKEEVVEEASEEVVENTEEVEQAEEVVEEVKTEETTDETAEEVVEEVVEDVVESTEAEEVVEEAVEEVVENTEAEETVEENIENTEAEKIIEENIENKEVVEIAENKENVETEIKKSEEVKEEVKSESDFIKSLNEILDELENSSND